MCVYIFRPFGKKVNCRFIYIRLCHGYNLFKTEPGRVHKNSERGDRCSDMGKQGSTMWMSFFVLTKNSSEERL